MRRCDAAVGSWRSQIAELIAWLENDRDFDEGAALTRAYDLLCECPAEIATSLPALPPTEEFDSLLAIGAFESAALRLVSGPAGYMFSSGPNGRFIASVILPGMPKEITADGGSVANALLGAYLRAITYS